MLRIERGTRETPISAATKLTIVCISVTSWITFGLPSIASTFHEGISGATEWIIIGYLVVIAAVLLTFGRLSDMIGREPIFLTGLIVFILGSALSALAPSLPLLILARLFQGIRGRTHLFGQCGDDYQYISEQ